MSRSSSPPLLLTLPWWFLATLAALVYVIGVHGLPHLTPEDPLMARLASSTPTLAKPLSVLLLLSGAGSAIRSIVLRRQRQKLLARQNGIDSIRSLSWSQIEQLVGEAYRQQGYRVNETGGAGPDDGIDLSLERDGARTLVQCKHWRSSKVGVPIVREHLGVMTAHRADHGVIVCTGEFTAPAIAFAATNGIELVNGQALANLIERAQSAATTGIRTDTPTLPPAAPSMCPKCEAPMVERMAKRGAQAGKSFLGCSNYPTCRGTRAI